MDLNDPLILIPAISCLFFALVSTRFNLVLIFAYISSAGFAIPLLGRELYFYPLLFLLFLFVIKIIAVRQPAPRYWTRFEKILIISILSDVLYFILAKWGILGIPELTEMYSMVYLVMPPIFLFIMLFALRVECISSGFLLKTVFVVLGLICAFSLIFVFLTADFSVEVGKEFLGVNPNNFGALCASALIFLLISYPKNVFGKVEIITLAICLFIGLVLSQSRAAILALIISTIIILLYKKMLLKAFLFAPFIVAVILFIFLNVPFGINEKISLIHSAYNAGDTVQASSGRFALWGGAIDYMRGASFFAWLFGSGIGTYTSTADLYTGLVNLQSHSHNHFLNKLLVGGIWSLVLYLCMVGQLCIDCYKVFSQSEDRLSLAIFFMMVTYLFCDFFGPRFTGNSLFFVWPLIAIFYYKFDSFNAEHHITRGLVKES